MAAKRRLSELAKRDGLDNKWCIDCRNPNPQWASLSFGVFLCLQCAGTHRGFGVHISFVRSVSMDAWQDDQLQRMELGGNAPFRDFLNAYDPSGGYKDGASPYDTYHSWAATQYKQKLDALLAGKDWSPSPPPPDFHSSSRSASPNPTATQGLRKSRAQTTRTRGDSPGPVPDQKSQNEAYFASLGKLNATRPADLPPSQGGRYQGFGNTPTPPPANSHPSFGLSSANAPTFQDSPMTALSKGWSLLSSAVVGASKVVNENVIQPGMEKISDPAFQSNVRGYVSEASKRAADVGSSANQWSKNRFGVDVADTVYGVMGANPARSGYGQVSSNAENEGSALYDAGDDEDLFGGYGQAGSGKAYDSPGHSSTTGATASVAKPAKKEEEWDDWKEF
ncbi:hypothetical protein AGABI2DRAFT_195816 [Agaricus bisporus var. bisporus H97]|uniref:hypothetical protein n=1 Tax=Agaricus bisporus var. bisporus (strain H97 / ATCC MYA-4626 / FGSC 10389) TaxID=936046 RepID=UPI00029F75B4|nr:hypothetical protein AGABI2DRAFT_195816 [Agaricus bisporus var. bisporus H97]EKV42490.1 hypothetical protein AGABI2DRAFT_195816 [Agaricus bisporus var. bisporus H97]